MTNKHKAILWTITIPLWIVPVMLIVVPTMLIAIPFWLTYQTVLNLFQDESGDWNKQWR